MSKRKGERGEGEWVREGERLSEGEAGMESDEEGQRGREVEVYTPSFHL